ncbi:hypothetical protein DFR67_103385 [Williamsia limnetica]|uniref:Uncharacterized protein n=1 Tax=Williamsia limnetica TaxID=882452 RepID=A0A318RMD5_WILLI|nr:hypothetical protein [Williamsia limnetica]PYE19472.1 hypothetical protein DFR67_103385 [Williamsia limnetica]
MTSPYPVEPPEPPSRGPSRLVIGLLITLAVLVTVGLVVFAIGLVLDNDGTTNRGKSTVTVTETPPSTAQSPATTTSRSPASSATTTTKPTRSPAGLFGNAPLSPGMCESNGLCRLSSPTGNFMCYIDAARATCTAPRGEKLINGQTVNAISVDEAGNTELATLSSGSEKLIDRPEIGKHVFPYGNQVTAFGFTCAVAESTGVSCRQDDSGKGFSVTRQDYFFF